MDKEKIKELENENFPQSDSNEVVENLLEMRRTIDEVKSMLTTLYLKQNNLKDNQWLTSREVQKYLRITKTTLRRYRANSIINTKELNKRHFLYHIEDVKRLIENQKQSEREILI